MSTVAVRRPAYALNRKEAARSRKAMLLIASSCSIYSFGVRRCADSFDRGIGMSLSIMMVMHKTDYSGKDIILLSQLIIQALVVPYSDLPFHRQTQWSCLPSSLLWPIRAESMHY